jgi:hypothetical protein
MLKLSFFIHVFVLSCLVSSAQVRLRFVNASPDSAYGSVDFYIDGLLAADSVAFQYTSMDLSVDTNTNITIHVCPASSQDTSSSIYRTEITTGIPERRLFIFNGLTSAGYEQNIEPSLIEWLGYLDTARLEGFTNFGVANFTGDLKKFDLRETSNLNGIITNDLESNAVTSYDYIETLNYTLLVQDSLSEITLRELNFDLAHRGLSGDAAHLLLTGFSNPSVNNNGPALQLMLLPDTAGSLIPFDNKTSTIQIVNNSYDPALQFIDVYIGSSLRANDLEFRSATAYLPIGTAVENTIGIAAGSSTSAMDTLTSIRLTTSSDDQHQLIVNGATQTNLVPFQPLEILKTNTRNTATLGYNVDVKLANSSPDLPIADFVEFDLINEAIITDLGYGEISTYKSIIPGALRLNLIGGTDTVKKYSPDLSSRASEAQTWVISGLVDTSNFNTTYKIGIWVVKPEGGRLSELAQTTSIPEINQSRTCTVYPNPTTAIINTKCSSRIERIILTDALGHELLQSSAANTPINIESLNAGNYILQIFTDKGISTHKVSVVTSPR